MVSGNKFVFSNCEKYTVLWADQICWSTCFYSHSPKLRLRKVSSYDSAFKKSVKPWHSETESTWPRKRLFCHVIVKNYLCNALCQKVFDQNRKNAEVRNQRTKLQLTFLYCGRTVRSSHRRFSIGVSLKKSWRSEGPYTGVFLWILRNFWDYLFRKTLEAAVLRCSSK